MWSDVRWVGRVLLARGAIDEAIDNARRRAGNNTPLGAIARFIEEALLQGNRRVEACEGHAIFLLSPRPLRCAPDRSPGGVMPWLASDRATVQRKVARNERAAREGHPDCPEIRRSGLTAVYRIGYCPKPAPPMAALLASLGYGSTLGNGRWHTQGPLQVVYCGSSRALCQLDKRVHANGANLKDQVLMQLVLPAGAPLQDVRTLGLPADWRANDAVTQQIGNTWIASSASLGLWVPSTVEPGCLRTWSPARTGRRNRRERA